MVIKIFKKWRWLSFEKTKNVTKYLDLIIKTYNIQKILDVPCGDFYWMKNFLKNKNIKYQGGDIVEELVEELKTKYESSNNKFLSIDITSDQLPDADLLLCRDCFIHFSNEDIFRALDNFSRSNINYFLITHTINNTSIKNKDIFTGEYRLLIYFLSHLV